MAENKFLSSLKLPGSDVSYIIDAKYIGGELVSDVLDDLRSAVASAMVFKGTLGVDGTISTLPTATKDHVGDTYKVVTDGTYAGQAAELGDVFICADVSGTPTWVYVPSGNEEEGTVTELTKGDGVKFVVDGIESATITDKGIIKLDNPYVEDEFIEKHTHEYSATGSHDHTFTGKETTISMGTYTPTGTVTLNSATVDNGGMKYTPSGSVSITHTATGDVSSSFVGTAATIDVTGALSSVEVADHTINHVSEVKSSFVGTAATIEVTGAISSITAADHTIPYVKEVNSAFAGTPATITMPDAVKGVSVTSAAIPYVKSVGSTFTGSEGTVSVTGNVAGSTDVAVVTSTSTTAETVVKSIETSTAGISAIDSVSLVADKYDQATQELTLGLSTTNATGTFVTDVTPTDASVIKSVTDNKSAVAISASGTMTGKFTPDGSIANTYTRNEELTTYNVELTKSVSAAYTPAGTVTNTYVTNTDAIVHDLTPVKTGVSAAYTPAGTITNEIVKTAETVSHTVTTKDTGVSAAYTPAGTVTSTFTGNADAINGTFAGTDVWFAAGFSGVEKAFSTAYTPEGTISSKELTFSGETGVGSMTSNS